MWHNNLDSGTIMMILAHKIKNWHDYLDSGTINPKVAQLLTSVHLETIFQNILSKE
jgi:hypothetical protein